MGTFYCNYIVSKSKRISHTHTAHVHNHGKEYGYTDQGLRQFVARTPNIDWLCSTKLSQGTFWLWDEEESGSKTLFWAH